MHQAATTPINCCTQVRAHYEAKMGNTFKGYASKILYKKGYKTLEKFMA
jgi:hypothetical protein